ncbi:MAG: AAA family ATPase, partial [Planctomycetota bacterium]|nr:AAA family ATPase [Planctomycetota bacterium]
STQRVYDECWTRARNCLLSGGRVIVDATFQRNENRQCFLQLAIDCGIRPVWLECQAPVGIARSRLESRRGDASDADCSVYQLVRSQWEHASEFTERFHAPVECGGDSESAMSDALRVLHQRGLMAQVSDGAD